MSAVLDRLEAAIRARLASGDTSASHVARLAAGGVPAVARKLGEEAVETLVAALAEDEGALTREAADLLFHLMVLLAVRGVAIGDVMAELERREGRSGIEEKAGRG